MLGWRDTPVNGDAIGREARASQPYIEQLFVSRPEGDWTKMDSSGSPLSRSPPDRERDRRFGDRGQGNLLYPFILLSHHHPTRA